MLCQIDLLECDSFEFVMCIFLATVTRLKDGAEYPGKTLYQLVVLINSEAFEHKRQELEIDRKC